MNEFGIGSTVWVFDENHRVYRDGKSAPVWREHWRRKQVKGETSRSWVVGDGDRRYGGLKLAKAEVVAGTYDRSVIALSEQDIDRAEWVRENRYIISGVIDRLNDYYILQQVAMIVGYKEPNK
jgi:hypothetical protein